MQHHARAGLNQRVEDYGQDEYDEYDDYEEVEGSEAEDDEEEHEDPKPTKEEQDFLKLREKMKEKFRQKLKKQSSRALGRSSQSQASTTVANDNFGSFFGPSKPVIAARVLEESRSMRETRHIVAKVPNSSTSYKKGPVSTSTETKRYSHDQRPQFSAHDQRRQKVEEVKNKAKTLKVTRDYSFLMSDEADLPEPVKEEPAPRKVKVPKSDSDVRPVAMNARSVPRPVPSPVPRPVTPKVPVRSSDGRSVGATLKSKTPASLPARVDSKSQGKNSASASQHMQSKLGYKEPPMYKSKPASVEARKGIGISAGNGSSRPAVREALPQKVSAHSNSTMKPPTKIVNGANVNKRPVPGQRNPNSSIHNYHSNDRRVTQGQDKLKGTLKQPLPSSKIQPMKPSKQIPARHTHDERPRKRQFRRDDPDEEEGAGAIQLIRSMFGYNPNKYKQMDYDDDSDMEADFDSIMEEEARSARIARKEDEEQLRLIEEEEKRERMRKKQRMSGRR